VPRQDLSNAMHFQINRNHFRTFQIHFLLVQASCRSKIFSVVCVSSALGCQKSQDSTEFELASYRTVLWNNNPNHFSVSAIDQCSDPDLLDLQVSLPGQSGGTRRRERRRVTIRCPSVRVTVKPVIVAHLPPFSRSPLLWKIGAPYLFDTDLL
jgi:hypothetical protein